MTRFRPGFIGAGPVFHGVNFNGSTELGLSGLVGGQRTKVGILSFWVRMTGADDDLQTLLQFSDGGLVRTTANRVVNNTIRFQGRNTDGTGTVSFTFNTNQTFTASATEYAHLLFAWDSANNVAQMYLNDVVEPGTNTTDNVDTGWDADQLLVGANNFNADVAEIYLNTEETLDLSVEANRRKFIRSDGGPVSLGNDGSAPTGNAPSVFLSGQVDDWHINKGTGGGFSETGTLTHVDFP